MATLKDVARAAGVSTATVSRALGGTGYVSDEVKHRVMAAVKDLNYQMNGIARSLRNAKTNTIGVLVPDISNPYFMEIIRSFEEDVSSSNYNILVASSAETPEKEQKLVEVFVEKRVDAIVLATCQEDVSRSVAACQQGGVPVLLIDRSAANIDVDTVVEESVSSTYEIVKYLISLGHRKISMINGSAPISTISERERGFRQALEDFKVPLVPEYIQHGEFTQESGYYLGNRLLTLSDPPTAIFCSNNFITVGLMVAANNLKVRIPEDVSVVSFGELLLPELIQPRVTAVIQDPEKVGKIASRILLHRIEDKSLTATERTVLSTYIRLGDSVLPRS
ncbi:LacI family DNA-binding transcriptional regulator [Alicyclobacillus sp. SO9]|uniref:LacI family DNA-binding transcriptional regulator n=1 Tax=Alicyclobacillus sp. SO9 TaxID=2665646 RepID=UPI0018E8DCC1|nr:LacI family DNA-binding transcriptional regulator [Alicyclobacillus sp. SO9]QQE80560.1 LacI family DNA-binding transcriptional regulator [Alicyclobacillus sp. SO9]